MHCDEIINKFVINVENLNIASYKKDYAIIKGDYKYIITNPDSMSCSS